MGDSVHAALDPVFGFDCVYTFEPVESLAKQLCGIGNSRLTVIHAGMIDADGKRIIYHAGTLAGSIYADAPSYIDEGTDVECDFLEASRFFRENIKNGDIVYMKLNCEGAECAILENLLATGEINKLTEVLVDFDALKIPSQAHRVAQIIDGMRAKNAPYHTPEQVQYGMINNYGGIRNWLLVTGASQAGLIRKISSVLYQLKIMLTKEYNGYYKMRVLKKLPVLRLVINKLRGSKS